MRKAVRPTKRLLRARDLQDLREQIEKLIKARAVEMVETTVQEAGKGQPAAMKYLFEMVGLYPSEQEVQESDGPWTRTLLRRLRLPEVPLPEEDAEEEDGPRDEVTKDTVVQLDPGEDAVE